MVAGHPGNTFVLVGWGKPIINFIKIINHKFKFNNIIIITHPKKKHFKDTIYFDDNRIYESIFDINDDNVKIIETNQINDQIIKIIKKNNIKLIISVGSKFIFKKKFIKTFCSKLINFHPSFLPDERGGANFTFRILQEKKFVAATAHFIDENIDSGNIIYRIKSFNIKSYDLKNYFFETYKLYDLILSKILDKIYKKKNIMVKKQINLNATYFNKINSTKHGRINLNWDVNDIDIFIKAFSRPYKGAYLYLGKKKIHIIKSTQYKKQKIHPFLFGKIKKIAKDGSVLVFFSNGLLKINQISLGTKLVKPSSVFKLSSWLK